MPNDDRFEDREAEIQRTAREAALRQFPNPNRIGCPDSETIIGIAAKTVPFNHPAMVHVAQCSECLQDIARLEEAAAVKRQRRLWAGAAVLLILVGMGTMVGLHVLPWPTPPHNGGPKSSAARIAVLDLRPFAPYRGAAKSRHVPYSFNTASGSAHTINVSVARLKTGTIRDPIARRSPALGSLRWRSDSNHRQRPYARHAG